MSARGWLLGWLLLSVCFVVPQVAPAWGQPPGSLWQIGTPIVTYYAGPGMGPAGGPPMTDAAAQQMAEGGWNLVFCSAQELDIAQRHGLRALLTENLLSSVALGQQAPTFLDALIEQVKDHPAMHAYYIIDEYYGAASFPWLGQLVAYLRERDPAHLAYINLYPTYASNEQLGTTGDTYTAYREYLRRYVDIVKPDLLSYDHYHFYVGYDGNQYFLNLALIREAALTAGIPFQNVVQAAGWGSYRVPNSNEVRWLVYTSLAYGAQGISYYVYCWPGHSGGIANPDGTPTPLYYALCSINREFTAIAGELQSLTSPGVYHVGTVPWGGNALPAGARFTVDPPVPMVLGYFGPQSEPTHVVAVNLDYTQTVTTTVVGPGPLEVFDAESQEWHPSPDGSLATVSLIAGGGKLLRLRALLETYTISGTILDGSANPISGVHVTAGSYSDDTAGDGTYAITGVLAGTYTVTPSKAGWIFAPTSVEATVNETVGNDTGNDFTGTEVYSISGTVTDEEHAAIQGVTVTINGQSTTTLSDGTYTISGFVAGTYTVTPSLTEHRFTPDSSSATVNESVGNATGVDFVGTNKIHSISGRITDDEGHNLEGATVTADGHSTTTAANGTYTIDRLVAGTYTVTPTMPEYDFAPLSTEVSVSDPEGDATGVDFVGTQKTYSISGTVTDEEHAAIQGVTVTINGQSTTTLSDGTYTISGFVAGTYTVTPSLTEHKFTPTSSPATVNESVGDATGVDFVGTDKSHFVSGRITDDEGHSLEGATVTADGHSTTTAANGTYTIDRLVAGTYTVTPTMPEYDFAPVSTQVSVSDPEGDATDVDFVGTQKTYTVSGTITNEQDEPMEGVELSAGSESTTTGSDGTYTLEELVAGTYAVIPSFSEYDFTPSSTNVTVNENDGSATGVDFAGSPKTYSISGTITDNLGEAVAGVEVTANGHSAITSPSGAYSVGGPVAGTYTVTPALAEYGFVPASQDVTVNETVGDASGIDFTAWPAYNTLLPRGLSMVGVPCYSLEEDPAVVFGTDNLAAWCPSPNPPHYVVPGDPGAVDLLAVEPGKGYFVRHAAEFECQVMGAAASTGTQFVAPLGPDWNLVANPFPESLLFERLLTGGSDIMAYGFVYDPDSGSYVVVTSRPGINVARNSIGAWEALWVLATKGSTSVLSIQPPSPVSSEAESAQPQQLDVGDGWVIPVVARVNGRGDLSSAVGVTTDGNEHIIHNPPAAPRGVDVFFVDDQGRRLAQYLKPIRPGELSWDFVVRTDVPESDVELMLPDLSMLPIDLTVTLTDLDTGRHVYARTMPKYVFRSNGDSITERDFRLTVAPKQTYGLVITSAAARQDRNAVGISYSVSKSCCVTIQVCNIGGRVVATVVADRVVPPGTSLTTWTLRSHTGGLVPAGYYLIVIEALADDGQQVKTILPASVVR